MSKMEYLKNLPVAVLGGGAVGKTCAADIKLAGHEVRLYDVMPFAEKSLKDLDKTGILFDGIQRNRDCFERSGRAFIDIVTTDIEKAIKGAGHIVVSCGSWGHEAMFRAMIPYLEDGQVVNVFADNFGCLLLRRLMRDNPNIENSIFRSIHNVAIDTMPGYRSEGVDHSFLERFNAMENH